VVEGNPNGAALVNIPDAKYEQLSKGNAKGAERSYRLFNQCSSKYVTIGNKISATADNRDPNSK